MSATLNYVIKSQMELNFSYMSFIKDGGLFVPTSEAYQLGDDVYIELQLPGNTNIYHIEGKIVWITPTNSLYQIYAGVGVQFIGENAKTIHDLIKSNLDNTMDTGCYAYGGATNTMNV